MKRILLAAALYAMPPAYGQSTLEFAALAGKTREVVALLPFLSCY